MQNIEEVLMAILKSLSIVLKLPGIVNVHYQEIVKAAVFYGT